MQHQATINDVNGQEIVLTAQTRLYDTVNGFEIVANYDQALDSDRAYEMILHNIKTGRLIAAAKK